MVSMMKDVVVAARPRRHCGAGFRVPAGGKTGTTNDGADVWFIGYTADLVAGVWMGFDKPKKIKANAQGGELAAPAWTAFMKEVYRRKPAATGLAASGWRCGARDRCGYGAARRVRRAAAVIVTASTSCSATNRRLTCLDMAFLLPKLPGDSAAPGAIPRAYRDTTNPFRIPPP